MAQYVAWIEGTEHEARWYIGKGGYYAFTEKTAFKYKTMASAKAGLARAIKSYHKGHKVTQYGYHELSQ